MWVVTLLLVAAALPIIPAYCWLRFHKFPLTALWFLLSLFFGTVSLCIAALLQTRYSGATGSGDSELGTFVFTVFIRIALTEETGRLLALFGLFCLMRARALRRFFPMAGCFDAE
ncbi:MAG: hypothetical protein LBD24_09730, partial [Spirochaetaceae bacterium]|nr:hypothetical protein [Spirochaetaceae bacterium]